MFLILRSFELMKTILCIRFYCLSNYSSQKLEECVEGFTNDLKTMPEEFSVCMMLSDQNGTTERMVTE